VFLLEGVCDRFVVCEDAEVACFQHLAEILYVLVDGQQLEVVGILFLLSRVGFFFCGKEGEGIPGVFDAFL
jgi:hypothetical protein